MRDDAAPKPSSLVKAAVDQDAKLLSLRTAYWTKRLDHTLNHTQTSSRLIYLLDGAVLAFLYFSVQTLGATRPMFLIASLPTALLAVLNVFHARLITIQHDWYSGIDRKLIELLRVDPVDHREPRTRFASTHGIYRAMHITTAIVLCLAAVAMLLYGLGPIGLVDKASG
ncbi:MAG: hypothetical protein U0Q55_13395 [Vicinamibacterales bacterium]